MPQLVIFYAHPDLPASRTNRVLRDAAGSLPNVTIRDLYRLYPRGIVDRQKEQDALHGADVIISQYPMFWYSMPPLLKEWTDSVLEFGWAYGPGGTQLAGKRWMHCVTTGGDAAAYQGKGEGRGETKNSHRYTIEEFLRPQEQTAHLCKTQWLKPWVLHDANQLGEAELQAAADRYKTHLSELARLIEFARPGEIAPLSEPAQLSQPTPAS